jgi:hypothetical protein
VNCPNLSYEVVLENGFKTCSVTTENPSIEEMRDDVDEVPLAFRALGNSFSGKTKVGYMAYRQLSLDTKI